MARQITTALTMSLEERRDRWQSMVRKLKAGSVQNWFSDFLHTLSDVQRAPVRTATAPIVLELARRRRSALTPLAHNGGKDHPPRIRRGG